MTDLEWASSLQQQVHSIANDIDGSQAELTKAISQFAWKPPLRGLGLRDLLTASECLYETCDELSGVIHRLHRYANSEREQT